MIEYRQGHMSMSAPAKEFEKRIIEGELCHDGNPVMRWMVSNVAIREDKNGNITPIKPERSSRNKVDGVVSSVMATGLHMARDLAPVKQPRIIVL